MSSIIKEEYDTFDGYVDALEDRVEELESPVTDVNVEMLLCELIAVAKIPDLPGYVYDVCAKSIHYIERLKREIREQVKYVGEAGTRAADYKSRIEELENRLHSARRRNA